jgi:hypothetical protein
MEEVMAERRKKKLACFQKTRHGVVKKGDMMKASTPVNSPFTLEELVYLIDVSVNSKYGVDLEGVTRALTESVKGSVESLRLELKQESKKMPRQIRAMVQQVLGESKGKRDIEGPDVNMSTMGASSSTTPGPQFNLGRTGNPGGNTSPNFPQPFYQVHAYGLGNQLVPDAYFPRPPDTPFAAGEAYLGMSENVREQVARTLREFRLQPKGRVKTYQKPYPEFFDSVSYPRGFRVPDFVKFTGEDSKTTYEHVGQFLAQVNDFGITDVHKITLFPLSLSSTAFNWFVSLLPNSMDTWERLEQR